MVLHNLAIPKAIIAYKPTNYTGNLCGGLKSTVCEAELCKSLPALKEGRSCHQTSHLNSVTP